MAQATVIEFLFDTASAEKKIMNEIQELMTSINKIKKKQVLLDTGDFLCENCNPDGSIDIEKKLLLPFLKKRATKEQKMSECYKVYIGNKSKQLLNALETLVCDNNEHKKRYSIPLFVTTNVWIIKDYNSRNA